MQLTAEMRAHLEFLAQRNTTFRDIYPEASKAIAAALADLDAATAALAPVARELRKWDGRHPHLKDVSVPRGIHLDIDSADAILAAAAPETERSEPR